MIVVDSSALMAVAGKEIEAARCARVLESSPELLISAGTFLESLIVARLRGLGAQMVRMIDALGFEIVPVSPDFARRAALHYPWGKGLHPAGLNFGDCFAYTLAKDRDCPLLFVGNDFSKTDVRAIP